MFRFYALKLDEFLHICICIYIYTYIYIYGQASGVPPPPPQWCGLVGGRGGGGLAGV